MNVDGSPRSEPVERLSESAERVSEPIERDAVRSASRLLFAAASLVFLLSLGSVLPGIDRLVPSSPVTFAAVASAIVTVAVVGLLLTAAPKLAFVARTGLRGPEPVVENLASIVHWLVVLAAVIVAHRGLAGIVTPLFGDFAWAYDVAFLLAALPPVVFVAARLFVTVDPAADLVADRVTGEADIAGNDAATPASSDLGAGAETEDSPDA